MSRKQSLTRHTLIHFLAFDAGKIPTLDRWHRDWTTAAKPGVDVSERRMGSEELCAIQKAGYFRIVGASFSRLVISIKQAADICQSLTFLCVQGCAHFGLAGMEACQHLRVADFSHCDTLEDLWSLGQCRVLRALNLSYCSRFTSLRALAKCTSLSQLHVRGCFKLEDLSGLCGTQLADLDLTFCKAVLDLSPLLEYKHLRCVNLGERKLCDLSLSEKVQQHLRDLCVNDLKSSWIAMPRDFGLPVTSKTVSKCGTQAAHDIPRSNWYGNAGEAVNLHDVRFAVRHRCGSEGTLQCARCSSNINGVVMRGVRGEPLHYGCSIALES